MTAHLPLPSTERCFTRLCRDEMEKVSLADEYDQFITAYVQQLEGLVFILKYELQNPTPGGPGDNFFQLLWLLDDLMTSGEKMRMDFGKRLREQMKGDGQPE